MSGKVSIKLKDRGGAVVVATPVLKMKNDISLNTGCSDQDKKKLKLKFIKQQPKKEEGQVKVEYVFLDEGEFLYEAATRKLYEIVKPHRVIGYIDPETLQVKLVSKP